jgi:ABC-type dipeptide/oligopeptide/nickel transport system permease subunit
MGAIAGLNGGWIDGVIGRVIDVTLAFPWLLVAMFLTATVKPYMSRLAESVGWDFLESSGTLDYLVVVGALGLIFWGDIARVVRGDLLSLREREFVIASKADGASKWFLIRKHLVPNALGPVVVMVTLAFGGALLLEAALSFLGIGIQPPAASFGSMINDSLVDWRYHPHLVLVPVGVIALVLVAFTVVGDRLNDALDPRRHGTR